MYSVLLGLLLVWMLGCGYAGYLRSLRLFAVIFGAGVVLNTLWMVIGLQAHPLEGAALMAHAAALVYALAALASGWLIGRWTRAIRNSRTAK